MLGAYSGLAFGDGALALDPRKAALESLKVVIAGSLARRMLGTERMLGDAALPRRDGRRRSPDLIAALQGIKQV
jgi:hypothetical protein